MTAELLSEIINKIQNLSRIVFWKKYQANSVLAKKTILIKLWQAFIKELNSTKLMERFNIRDQEQIFKYGLMILFNKIQYPIGNLSMQALHISITLWSLISFLIHQKQQTLNNLLLIFPSDNHNYFSKIRIRQSLIQPKIIGLKLESQTFSRIKESL